MTSYCTRAHLESFQSMLEPGSEVSREIIDLFKKYAANVGPSNAMIYLCGSNVVPRNNVVRTGLMERISPATHEHRQELNQEVLICRDPKNSTCPLFTKNVSDNSHGVH